MRRAVGSTDKSPDNSHAFMASNSTETESDAAGLRTGDGEMRRSRCRRAASGGGGPGQASESALFSPPAKTREEELERVHLLEVKRSLKKTAIRDATGTSKEPASATSDSLQGNRDACRSRSDVINMTDILELLVTEMARMRITLDSFAQDRAVLNEIQKTNRLLALAMTSGHSLEFVDTDHNTLAKKVKQKAPGAETILKTMSCGGELEPSLSPQY